MSKNNLLRVCYIWGEFRLTISPNEFNIKISEADPVNKLRSKWLWSDVPCAQSDVSIICNYNT